jgi:hypothetical protein
MSFSPIVIGFLHRLFLHWLEHRAYAGRMLLISSAGVTASLLHHNAKVEPHLPHIYNSSLNNVSAINQSEYRYQLRRKASIYVVMVSKKRRRKSISSDAKSGKLSRNRKELSS